MKVYVSARFEQADEVRLIQEKLKRASFEIAYDWTQQKDVKEAQLDQLGRQAYAMADFRGVQECDALILFHTVSGGQTKFVELGLALALGKKCIVVAGPGVKDCIFFYLPGIKIVESVENALLGLGHWRDD